MFFLGGWGGVFKTLNQPVFVHFVFFSQKKTKVNWTVAIKLIYLLAENILQRLGDVACFCYLFFRLFVDMRWSRNVVDYQNGNRRFSHGLSHFPRFCWQFFFQIRQKKKKKKRVMKKKKGGKENIEGLKLLYLHY